MVSNGIGMVSHDQLQLLLSALENAYAALMSRMALALARNHLTNTNES